jgi:hypothetical protein
VLAQLCLTVNEQDHMTAGDVEAIPTIKNAPTGGPETV